MSPLSLGIARAGSNNWGEFKGLMQEVRIYDGELSAYEVEILSGQGSIQSFTTGTQPTPPVVRTLPAVSVTESNATLGYELVTYDGSLPEIILYWGPVDRGENEGLWANQFSLGNQGVGSGYHVVSGFTPGQDIYYQVQAKGTAHNDWGDAAGYTRTVSAPTVSVLPSVDQTESSATLRGQVLGNGGLVRAISLSQPMVSQDLIAHWRFDEGQGQETYDSTGFTTAAQVFSGANWTDGRGGQFGKALSFDGSALAYVQVGTFRIEGDMSFSGWAYKRNLGNWQRMFDFGSGTNDNLLIANRGTTSEVEWGIRRGGGNIGLVAQDFWTLNEWQHIVATVDQSSVMKIYRNGQLMGSRLGHLPRNMARVNQYIGKSNWPDAYFDGMMDDLRVYDRAINQDEVSLIYAGDLEQNVTMGGEDPVVTLFWGDEDAGQTTAVNAASADAWDASNLLGVMPKGEFSFPLAGLQVGKTYYYRFLATNSAGSSWSSSASTFSTGSFGFKANSFADGNLLLWLDASDTNGDGNLSNEPLGGVLDQWRDKSGSSRHAGNGKGPDLNVARWNGLPTLGFDGQSQYLRVDDSSVFDFGEDATIFIVAKGGYFVRLETNPFQAR